MNRKQFLQQLETKVKHLDYDVRQDILNEFDVHIRQGVHTGLSEEEVVRSLGDFDEIVDGLLEQEEVKTQQEEKTVDQPVEKDKPSKKITVERASKPVQNTKYLDLDPNKIENLRFEVQNATVVVEAGDKFEMDYESSNENSELTYDVIGNVLTFRQESEDNKGIFGFFKNTSKNRLIITWPGDLDTLEADVDQGAVRITGLTIDELNVECDMGSVTGQSLIGKHFSLTSDMGRVTLENSQADSIETHSDMGTVTIDNCTAKVYNMSSDMGTVNANNINADADGTLKTDMGTVKVTFRETPTNTEVIANANMGNAVNPYSDIKNATYRFTLNTDMGSIVIK